MQAALYKGDLRKRKTHKALLDALYAVLGSRNFNDITVNDICNEALISRAAFYSHFNDKYDLLSYLLENIRTEIVREASKYDDLEREMNQFVYQNKKLISNILKNANGETLALVREFISSITELVIKRSVSNPKSPQHIILVNFIVGGLVNLLAWIVENNFPAHVRVMNTYLYKMLENLTDWDAEQELL